MANELERLLYGRCLNAIAVIADLTQEGRRLESLKTRITPLILHSLKLHAQTQPPPGTDAAERRNQLLCRIALLSAGIMVRFF